jgi:hypothetical protein
MPKKGEIEPGVVILMTGPLILLAGFCILGFQAALWLKNGSWTSELVGDFLPRGSRFAWKGVEILWDYFLDWEVSLALVFIGSVTFLAALWVYERAYNAPLPRSEPAKKFSSGRTPAETSPALEPVNDSPRVRGRFAGALPRLAQALYIAAGLWALWLLRH